MMSLARDIRYHHAAVLEMMWVDHERNIMHFVGERQHIEACCVAAGELLDRADALMAGLQVNEANMRANLNRLGGLTQSEHVMLELGKRIGKQHAHELISTRSPWTRSKTARTLRKSSRKTIPWSRHWAPSRSMPRWIPCNIWASARN
ncbi:MAG: hypothetical protein ACLU9S_05240 [Oscillospiraceae bacterium]